MRKPLVFALNGERVELSGVDPHTSLLNYIRNQTNFKGTKRGCGEGGCGSCVVMLSKYNPQTKEVEENTINSCLAPLHSIDGHAVTTTEGLTTDGKPHTVHNRLAGFHGSQCGFCTPGMSMAIYSCLQKKKKEQANLTILEAQEAVAGNICRCTGYRPILDACKSFAGDVDLEDLGINTFWESKKYANPKLLCPYDPSKDPKFPSFLVAEHLQAHTSTEAMDDPGCQKRAWLTPSSLSQTFGILGKYEGKSSNVQYVVGNTSSGVYKDFKPDIYVDISRIPELNSVEEGDGVLEVGAAVSLSKLILALEVKKRAADVVYSELVKHLRQVANQHVRNRASVGGNLIMAQQLGFASDVATILLGAGAEVTVDSLKGSRVLPLEEFLALGSLQPRSVLKCIQIPSSGASRFAGAQLLFKTYRSSPRASGNAVSSINAAFLAVLGGDGGESLESLRLAFGAVGGPHATRAYKTEEFLTGKTVSSAVLQEAVRILREEISTISQDDKLHTSAYRESVAVGFLFQFLNPLLPTKAPQPALDANCNTTLQNWNETNGSTYDLGESREFGGWVMRGKKGIVMKGRQKFVVSNDFFPVSQPTEKIAAALQASGEALYTGDIPTPEGALFGAFVLSKKALAIIKAVDASQALDSPGVVAFVSARDIPVGGQNTGFSLKMLGSQEKVFADERVEYVGDPLGIIVADTHEHAVQAAEKVKVDYDCITLGRPMLSIQDAVVKDSYKESAVFGPSLSASIGSVPEKSDHRIENAEVSSGGQYFFYMETQNCLVIPDEDNCITVHSSSQSPENVQSSLSVTLGIPMHNIRVICRRMGGGFGGKATKCIQVASACAVAALKVKRPVRMELDRNTDMAMMVGRHESETTYSVHFNKDGKILHLETKVFLNGGWGDDFKDLVGSLASNAMKAYNWNSWRHTAKICRTNLPARSTMRGPGHIQGCFIAETVIEHVAAYLGLDAHKVREINMHTHQSLAMFHGPAIAGSKDSFTLPLVYEKLKSSSRFEARKLDVQRFNACNKWTKKGVAITPIVYSCTPMPRLARVSIYEDGSVVVEVGGTEMGQGLFTKVQQAVSYGLSQLWIDHETNHDSRPPEDGTQQHSGLQADEKQQHHHEKGETLLQTLKNSENVVELSRIRVVQNDTISLPNGGITSASTTSEGTCEAAVVATKTLVSRLKPLLLHLQSKGTSTKPVAWNTVVKLAKLSRVKLSAEGESNKAAIPYIVYGACVSEVVIDVLTGSTTILQSDLLYDCGKSLNPAIDIGQIEGSFVQGIGYFLTEEMKWDENGVLITNGTWTYKPPTVDNIPQQFNVELVNFAPDRNRIMSSKASGEPPLLLAMSVHCAIRAAITAAREDMDHHVESDGSTRGKEGRKSRLFRMDSLASMEKVKDLCGLYNVDQFLASLTQT